jgi:hypothetical protein
VGLFGIVSALISTSSIPDVEERWRVAFTIWLGVGLYFFALSCSLIFPAYAVVDSDKLDGFAGRVRIARQSTALKELNRLWHSMILTFLGLLAIFVAMAVSWNAPRVP